MTPDFDTFRRLLPIQKHELDEELALQAEFLQHISHNLVRAKSFAAQAKDALERLEAELHFYHKENSGKMTVAELNGKIICDRRRIIAFEKLQAALGTLSDWEGMYESWKARGFALRSLVDLRLANYYTPESISGGGDDYSSMRREISRIRKEQYLQPSGQGTTARRRIT